MKAGWQSVKLADLADFGNGLWKGKKGPFKQVIVIRNTNFRADGRLSLQDAALLDVEVKQFKTRMLEFGDIIIEKSGGGPKQPVGRVVAFLEKEGSFSFSNFTSRIRVVDKGRLEPSYLLKVLDWWYKSGKTISMQRQSTGIRNLDFKTYQQQEVPLPPLEEQQAIVDKLDRAFAGLETARANAEANLENAKELFQAGLNSVIGKGSDLWQTEPINTNVTFVDYRGRTPKKAESGVRLITAKNVKMGFINVQPQEFMEESQYQSWMTRGFPEKGDVLFTTEAPLGNVAQLDTDERVVIGQRLITMKANREVLSPSFLKFLIMSSNFQQALEDNKTGATVSGIKASLLKKIPISYPSLQDQKEIVGQLEDLTAETDRLQEEYSRQLSDLDELKQSLLQKAFAGELT